MTEDNVRVMRTNSHAGDNAARRNLACGGKKARRFLGARRLVAEPAVRWGRKAPGEYLQLKVFQLS